MSSARYWDKKKNPIPPPIIATQAKICLILDIMRRTSKLTIESNWIHLDNYNYIANKSDSLASIKDVGKFFLFIVGGIVAIIVGAFMIRGTMHLWDKPEKKEKADEEDND